MITFEKINKIPEYCYLYVCIVKNKMDMHTCTCTYICSYMVNYNYLVINSTKASYNVGICIFKLNT